MLHGDRLICDNEVIIGSEVVQTLNVEEFTCAAMISLDTMIFGMLRYGAIFAFRWIPPG